MDVVGDLGNSQKLEAMLQDLSAKLAPEAKDLMDYFFAKLETLTSTQLTLIITSLFIALSNFTDTHEVSVGGLPISIAKKQ